jgi:serine/threonine protein kinase
VAQFESFLEKTIEGEPTVSVPFPSVMMLKDRTGRMRTETPTMFVCAPVRDDNLQVVAVLGMRVRPEREFTEILQLGRMGESGETYAVNKQGIMVSNSRFDEELILSGILPDEADAISILKVQVRDPGGDLKQGFRPNVRRGELPLTEICAKSLSGSTGVTTKGYRDYQGSLSVGAWTWLPKYQLGLITEMDSAEAFRPLTILNRFFYSLYALLVTGAIAIFVFTLVVARLQREAQKAAVEAKQLGQYRLETRLGAGAMGVVYKGHHAMLRRPTAIKMLQVDKLTEASIERFEREVQITCKLNHPNTIAIFDYGRTPEGVFYYAMEYLDGIDLQTLVERYGPQPEGRVVDILKQVCGSLYEAHSLGLVHRDIKPANIMLNRRGGESDVVKVLDFGLVKALTGKDASRDSGGLSGTPLYMSPESLQSPEAVDARTDLYALGAVGYFLLTGQTVFQAGSLSELCRQHLSTVPMLPSQRLGTPIAEDLENAIMACLDKNPARRPQTARDLGKSLTLGMKTITWTKEDADAWWGRHERELMKNQDSPSNMVNPSSKPTSTSAPSSSSGFDQTIASGGT